MSDPLVEPDARCSRCRENNGYEWSYEDMEWLSTCCTARPLPEEF